MNEIKNKKLNVRLTEGEQQKINADAKACGMSSSDYVRTKIFNDEKIVILSDGAEIAKLLINLSNSVKDAERCEKLTNRYALTILQGIDEIAELFNEIAEKLTDIHSNEEEGDE